MNKLRMKLYPTIFLILVLCFLGSCKNYEAQSFDMFLVNYKGQIEYIAQGKRTNGPDLSFKNIHSLAGFLYNNHFYTFEDETLLVRYQIYTGDMSIVSQLDTKIDQNATLRRIIFVDDSSIILSATKPDENHWYTYSFFVLELETMDVYELPINDCTYGSASSDGRTTCYINNAKEICLYDNSGIKNIGIHGIAPTISLDGTKIAYLSKDFLFTSIFLYDIGTKTNIKIFSLFNLYYGVDRKLRWSTDGRLLAIHRLSDFSSQPLYILNVDTEDVIYKIDKLKAWDWYFI